MNESQVQEEFESDKNTLTEKCLVRCKLAINPEGGGGVCHYT